MSEKAILQALLDDEPLSLAELREMILRQLRSGPGDDKNAKVCAGLLDAYKAVHRNVHGINPLTVSREGAEVILSKLSATFNPGVVWEWPPALPVDYGNYPIKIMNEIGHALYFRFDTTGLDS